MRAAGKFLRVGEAVIVRIPARAIVGIASAVAAFAESAVIERIEAVLILPAVGQTIAIAIGIQGIRFTPLLAAVVKTVVVGVAIDRTIQIFILTKSILQCIAIGVGKVRAGLGPCFKVVDETVGPIAGVRSSSRVGIAPGSERQGLAIAIRPAVGVLVLNAVIESVTIGIGLGRIRHRTRGLASAIVACAL